jgi:hypothetical protein
MAATAAASEEVRGVAAEEEEEDFFLFNLCDAEKMFLDRERAAMDMVIKPAANAQDRGGCVTDGIENGREEGSAVVADCN